MHVILLAQVARRAVLLMIRAYLAILLEPGRLLVQQRGDYLRPARVIVAYERRPEERRPSRMSFPCSASGAGRGRAPVPAGPGAGHRQDDAYRRRVVVPGSEVRDHPGGGRRHGPEPGRWNQEHTADPHAEASALDWSITAMGDAVERLVSRAGGRGPEREALP
jgi:hypothetical protein